MKRQISNYRWEWHLSTNSHKNSKLQTANYMLYTMWRKPKMVDKHHQAMNALTLSHTLPHTTPKKFHS